MAGIWNENTWKESRVNLVLDKAGKKLIAMGLLPPHTLSYDIVCELNKATILRTETYLTDDEYKRFLEVMVENRNPGNVNLNT
jgi:hypothetical protein